MLARCARCQQAFPTDRFGRQRCPHCGSEVDLADPKAPPPPPPPGPPPVWGYPPAPPAPPPPPGWGPPAGPPPPPPGGWGPLPPGGAPHRGEGEPSPFADRKRLGLVPSWLQTLKLVAFEPARFFRLVRASPSGSAVLFGVIGATLGGWVSLLFTWLTAAATFSAMGALLQRLQDQGVDPKAFSWLVERTTGVALVLQAVLTPVLALAAIYVSAALFHVVLLVLRGAPRGFDSTLTAVGYAWGIYLLTALPVCGGLVAAVWFAVAAIIGLAEGHRGPTWKAALAVSSPILLLCLCACGLAVLIPNILRMQGQPGSTSL